jgi:hypothetical protein
MQGTINGAYVNRTIVDGAGWESFRSATLAAVQANAVATATGVIGLGGGATLQDGPDWMLGMTFTLVDAQAPNSFANHTVSAAVGASVGGQSSTFMAAQGTSMDSAVAVAVALLGTQAAHALLADGKLDDLAAALDVIQADHALNASGSVQLAVDAAMDRADDAPAMDGVIAVASMAQLTQEQDALSSFIRRILEPHGYGEGLARHNGTSSPSAHDHGSRLTVH